MIFRLLFWLLRSCDFGIWSNTPAIMIFVHWNKEIIFRKKEILVSSKWHIKMKKKKRNKMLMTLTTSLLIEKEEEDSDIYSEFAVIFSFSLLYARWLLVLLNGLWFILFSLNSIKIIQKRIIYLKSCISWKKKGSHQFSNSLRSLLFWLYYIYVLPT